MSITGFNQNNVNYQLNLYASGSLGASGGSGNPIDSNASKLNSIMIKFTKGNLTCSEAVEQLNAINGVTVAEPIIGDVVATIKFKYNGQDYEMSCVNEAQADGKGGVTVKTISLSQDQFNKLDEDVQKYFVQVGQNVGSNIMQLAFNDSIWPQGVDKSLSAIKKYVAEHPVQKPDTQVDDYLQKLYEGMSNIEGLLDVLKGANIPSSITQDDLTRIEFLFNEVKNTIITNTVVEEPVAEAKGGVVIVDDEEENSGVGKGPKKVLAQPDEYQGVSEPSGAGVSTPSGLTTKDTINSIIYRYVQGNLTAEHAIAKLEAIKEVSGVKTKEIGEGDNKSIVITFKYNINNEEKEYTMSCTKEAQQDEKDDKKVTTKQISKEVYEKLSDEVKEYIEIVGEKIEAGFMYKFKKDLPEGVNNLTELIAYIQNNPASGIQEPEPENPVEKVLYDLDKDDNVTTRDIIKMLRDKDSELTKAIHDVYLDYAKKVGLTYGVTNFITDIYNKIVGEINDGNDSKDNALKIIKDEINNAIPNLTPSEDGTPTEQKAATSALEALNKVEKDITSSILQTEKNFSSKNGGRTTAHLDYTVDSHGNIIFTLENFSDVYYDGIYGNLFGDLANKLHPIVENCGFSRNEVTDLYKKAWIKTYDTFKQGEQHDVSDFLNKVYENFKKELEAIAGTSNTRSITEAVDLSGSEYDALVEFTETTKTDPKNVDIDEALRKDKSEQAISKINKAIKGLKETIKAYAKELLGDKFNEKTFSECLNNAVQDVANRYSNDISFILRDAIKEVLAALDKKLKEAGAATGATTSSTTTKKEDSAEITTRSIDGILQDTNMEDLDKNILEKFYLTPEEHMLERITGELMFINNHYKTAIINYAKDKLKDKFNLDNFNNMLKEAINEVANDFYFAHKNDTESTQYSYSKRDALKAVLEALNKKLTAALKEQPEPEPEAKPTKTLPKGNKDDKHGVK